VPRIRQISPVMTDSRRLGQAGKRSMQPLQKPGLRFPGCLRRCSSRFRRDRLAPAA
jgi:hypothetical protein